MSYVTRDEIHVERTAQDVTVYDADGEEVLQLPASFTAEQVAIVIERLNAAYETGLQHGRNAAIYNIHRALEIAEREDATN